MLADDSRAERASTIARHVHHHLPDLGRDRLRRRSVARVPEITAHRIVLVIAQMRRHLRLQRRLQHLTSQPRQQPTLTRQLHATLGRIIHQLLSYHAQISRLRQLLRPARRFHALRHKRDPHFSQPQDRGSRHPIHTKFRTVPRLEAEADKLLEAHYADAIDLPTLKRHQDRIRITLADVTRRLDAERHDHDGPRQHLATALRLLADCGRMYERTDDLGKRLANQAFYQRILITEDEKAAIQLNEPFAALAPTSTDVRCSSTSDLVDAMERCGNRRPRVERLVSAWNQGTRGDGDLAGEPDDPLIGTSAEPKKRPRTRLTDEEVDAMRTARAQGISVNAVARQFGVHRCTVWAKTR